MGTWIYQPNETDGIDTFIDANSATSNFATNIYLYAGYGGRALTSLLKLDFTKGTNPPPSGAEFSSVVLTLYHLTSYATVTSTLYVYRCLRNWVENQATWNIYSTGNNWGTAGARNSTTDYYATKLGSISQAAAESTGAKNITLDAAEITKMFNGTYNNYGFVMFLPDVAETLHRYSSSSDATSSNRPKVTAEWYVPGGNSVSVSPFFNFFKNFENPRKKKGGIWQPENGLATI